VSMDARKLAAMIDQTLLRPTVGQAAGREWIAAQRDAGFASLCVMPSLVPIASAMLEGSGTKVCTVVAFPLGYALSASKAEEARRLIEAGADEVDMVANIGAEIEGDAHAIQEDVAAVAEAVADASDTAILKVILETGYLTPALILLASEAAVRGGADFVKTSTGFGPRGASVEDVRVMRKAVGQSVGVKAAGGIRDLACALEMIDAGASRIGTSGGLEIIAALADSGA
jgi:deoxyribose-phosphate aldolase